ncbi:MAG TPA: prolipoprotein diacylglyceryl transferase [Polyangiaceae bacterium LLY-WYZ-14_1]|nr:prolipoprotein diacylglyceryl transferase [Polyangiaceae bacterium LLY-WYZ-14_1]
MTWNVDPVLFELGPLEIRWYGLFFAFGLLLTVNRVHKSFRDRKLPEEQAATLSLLLPLGMIIGAHLIHLIFYEPESFWRNPRRIIEIGYGLASHGGGLGVAVALWLYVRAKKGSFLRYLDAVMIGAVWLFPWVRIGNFFNSEIVGRATDLPWAVVFARRGEDFARHPVQLYEALAGFALIGVAEWMDRQRGRWPRGVLFSVLLGLYFTYRFLLEYTKEYQVLAPGFPLTMGQLLSLPPLLLAAGFVWARRNAPREAELSAGDGHASPEDDGSAGGGQGSAAVAPASTRSSTVRKPRRRKKR